MIGRQPDKHEMKCRIYNAYCVNPAVCTERDACCASDPDVPLVQLTAPALNQSSRIDEIRQLDENDSPDDLIVAVEELLATVTALKSEIARMEKHVAHNDEEYKVMKDVLRAEHKACCTMRPVYEAAKAWRASHHTGHHLSARPLVDAIDAAFAKEQS